MDTQVLMSRITDIATQIGFKVLVAIAVWIVGRGLIGMVVRMLQRALERQKVDATLIRYLGNN